MGVLGHIHNFPQLPSHSELDSQFAPHFWQIHSSTQPNTGALSRRFIKSHSSQDLPHFFRLDPWFLFCALYPHFFHIYSPIFHTALGYPPEQEVPLPEAVDGTPSLLEITFWHSLHILFPFSHWFTFSHQIHVSVSIFHTDSPFLHWFTFLRKFTLFHTALGHPPEQEVSFPEAVDGDTNLRSGGTAEVHQRGTVVPA